MKKILLVLSLVLALIVVKGQDDSPTLKGKNQINVGIGLFGWGGASFIPLHIGMDFFILNNFSLGFDANWRYYNSAAHKHQLFSGQIVVDYHFNELMNMSNSWDFYAGVKAGPGYMTDSGEWGALYAKGVKFVFDARIGVRYYFNEKLAVNSEVGVMSVSGTNTSGVTFLMGITAKL